MPCWSYYPQQVLTETLTADVRAATPSPLASIVGRSTDNVFRRWRLQYGLIPGDQACSMAAFYKGVQGPWAPFSWQNPNDLATYTVRFDGSMRLELFTPVFWRLGQDVVLVQVGSSAAWVPPEGGGVGGGGLGGGGLGEVLGG